MITYKNNWKEGMFRHVEFELGSLLEMKEIYDWLFGENAKPNNLLNAWISVRYQPRYKVLLTIEYKEAP
jgi:hypothetical protein